VKLLDKTVFIVETKGLEDLDVPLKMRRLVNWCNDVNQLRQESRFDFLFVDQKSFESYVFASFQNMVEVFTKFKDF
jgi:type III restriction enzyme